VYNFYLPRCVGGGGIIILSLFFSLLLIYLAESGVSFENFYEK
jgi:hypothetical protein